VDKFITKDSGERKEFDSGMVRDITTGKIRPDLLVNPNKELLDSKWHFLARCKIQNENSKILNELLEDFVRWYDYLDYGDSVMESLSYIEPKFLSRLSALMGRGAEKYGDNNWRLANGEEEMVRFKQSALRHFTQYIDGDTDEDHACAVAFNIMGYEDTKAKGEK